LVYTILRRLFWIPFILLMCFGYDALADEQNGEDNTERYTWALTLYGGESAQDDIGDVYSFQANFDDNAYVVVAALAREFWHYKQYIGFEVEGQVGKHFDGSDQWEFVGLIVGRWHAFPWDKYIDTSFAVGEGFSYYTEVSEVEKEEDDDAQRFLNYLMFELAFGLPQYPRWDMVVRIHHRSSVLELIGASGSNYVCGGIKFKF